MRRCICSLDGCFHFSTGISWYIVYRKDSYGKLKRQIEQKSKELDKLGEELTALSSRQEKKKKQLRKDLQKMQRDLSSSKLPSMVILFVGMYLVHLFLRGQVGGQVVAKLPFEPIPLLLKMTQRGLDEATMTLTPSDVSFTAIYLLSNLVFRSAVQKFFGLSSFFSLSFFTLCFSLSFLGFGIETKNMSLFEQAGWQVEEDPYKKNN